MKNRPELLSPAGSIEAFEAAISAGCNAIYLGGKKYGARAFANNFDQETLKRAFELAHTRDVQVYYTMNTLIKQDEMNSLYDEVKFLYEQGADALILQDLGMYQFLHQHFPEMTLHASTQMTLHSLEGAKFAHDLGFKRIVLSRELGLNEIKTIKAAVDIEIETFVHGALCYSYSGQCLMSSLIGGRSGNRGKCAQPCRLPYKSAILGNDHKSFILSPKDISSLEILPELMTSGIDSFKIEGRMKSAEYVGLVTYLYNHYMDLYLKNPSEYRVDEDDLKKIMQIYNRGGFSKGYYFENNGADMMATNKSNHTGVEIGTLNDKGKGRNLYDVTFLEDIRQGDVLAFEDNQAATDVTGQFTSFTADQKYVAGPNHLWITDEVPSFPKTLYRLKSIELNEEIQKRNSISTRKLKINGTFIAKTNQPMQLTVQCGEHELTCHGEIVQVAQKAALSEDKIRLQLQKMGEEAFEWASLDIKCDADIFMPLSQINQLRRSGMQALKDALISKHKRILHAETINVPEDTPNEEEVLVLKPEFQFLVRNMAQFEAIIEESELNCLKVLLEWDLWPKKKLMSLQNICSEHEVDAVLVLPRITRSETLETLRGDLVELASQFESVVIRTPDQFELVNTLFEQVHLDFTVPVMNQQAIDFWKEREVVSYMPSVELNQAELSQIKDPNQVIYVYGKLPVMVSAQCIYKTDTGKCQKHLSGPLYYEITDRMENVYKVQLSCRVCQNTLYNPQCLMLVDKLGSFTKQGIYQFRLEFIEETKEQVNILLSYLKHTSNLDPLLANLEMTQYTRGHFLRGID